MKPTSYPRPAVFLDRDGTLIKDVGYLSSIDDIEVFEFTRAALDILHAAGYLLVVVTNQSGVARGYLDEPELKSINDAVLRALDGLFDAFYFCPHAPADNCSCRKPRSGMIDDAAKELNIDIANSWIVGDKKSDIETGFNSGLATALVLTGYGEDELRKLDRMPDLIANDLLQAAREICARNDQ
jgi:D-glycero-D-manno-heptose 1,7-bisphosphate phosphatase